MKILTTADDVTPEILEAAEQTSEWFEGRIEWDEFIDKLATTYGPPDWDIEEYDNPAIRKIKRHVREYRRYF